MSVYIETHRSRLRPIEASDWELFQRLHSEPEIIELCFDRPSEKQIKEKFGGLRFYYDGGDQYIRGLTNFAEIWAENTCDQCGCPGHKGGTGWISTRCSIHRLKS